MLGNDAVNRLTGGAGADTISGRGAADTLLGGNGYDKLKGNDDGPKGDTLNCQTGRGKAFSGPNDTVQNCD